MNSEFEEILAGLPAKPGRSRLEPYRELIAELRRRRRTFREIAAILAENCHIKVAATTVMRFVADLSRKEKGEPLPSCTFSRNTESGNTSPVFSPTANDEVRRRIEELKHRPVQVEAPRKLFHYDPDKPLTLMPKIIKEKLP